MVEVEVEVEIGVEEMERSGRRIRIWERMFAALILGEDDGGGHCGCGCGCGKRI